VGGGGVGGAGGWGSEINGVWGKGGGETQDSRQATAGRWGGW